MNADPEVLHQAVAVIDSVLADLDAGRISADTAVKTIGLKVLTAREVVLEALRAPQNDGAAASEWRPIDSAPMDGTPVWAICMEAQNPTARVSWHGIGWQCVAAFEKFSPAGPARWWPTHWQPLHAPLAQPHSSQEPGTGGERS